jgi:hypothetical protein
MVGCVAEPEGTADPWAIVEWQNMHFPPPSRMSLWLTRIPVSALWMLASVMSS